MRTYILACCWAAAILLMAMAARFCWVERTGADLLLIVLPMIAFVTLLGRGSCRLASRGA